MAQVKHGIGEEKYNIQGYLMRIVEYNNYKDLIIEFQDYYKTRVHSRYEYFDNGNAKNPNHLKILRLGEKFLNQENCLMKIVEYRNSQNILIEFQDEYRLRKKTTYANFKHGKVKNDYIHLRETSKTTEGYTIEIIDIIKNTKENIVVEFQDDYKYKTSCQYDTFLKGNIKNPYHKSIIGVGYIGETSTSYNKKIKKSYTVWKHMIERCYSIVENKDLTYRDCIVDLDWHCYANFEKWYKENYYEVIEEEVQLDKDILFKNNKIYSPETCVFVPQRINNWFRDCQANKKSGLPYGTILDKKKYIVRCHNENMSYTSVGRFNTIKEAELESNKFKKTTIIKVINQYKDLIPEKTYKKILNSQFLQEDNDAKM